MKRPVTTIVTSADYLYRVVDGTVIQRRRHSWPGSTRWETLTDEDHDLQPPPATDRRTETRRVSHRKKRNRP